LPFLQGGVAPGDEKHIAQACLDGGGAREEPIGYGVSNAANAKFVEGLPFRKARQQFQGAFVGCAIMIEPRDG